MTYYWRILHSLDNRVIYFKDGSFRDHAEYFNLEDLNRTMKHHIRGVNKSDLRPLLDELVENGLLEIREGKEQYRTQSKGEYKISEEGKKWLQRYNEFRLK